MNSLKGLAKKVDKKIGGQRLAVAESCTGGMLGSIITDVSGCSRFFTGGVISYSDQIKHNVLKVPQRLLDQFGAVSPQVVEMMALGVRELLTADIAVAISGIAGPGGGSEEKPVGLVYIAWVWNNKKVVQKNLFPGQRKQIKQQSVQKALEGLLEVLDQ